MAQLYDTPAACAKENTLANNYQVIAKLVRKDDVKKTPYTLGFILSFKRDQRKNNKRGKEYHIPYNDM